MDDQAHLILEDVMKTDLKMDGIYSSGSLCFILSQFDRDFDCPDYWSQIPELQMALKPLRKKDMEIKAIIREREKELSEIQTSQENHEFKIEEIQNQLSAGETTATKSTKTNTRSGLKRKRGTGNDTAGMLHGSTPLLLTDRTHFRFSSPTNTDHNTAEKKTDQSQADLEK